MGNKKQRSNILHIFFYIFITLGIIGLLFYSKTTKEATTPIPQMNEKDILSITSDDHKEGSLNAKVVLIEYLDFECESCRAYFPLVKELKNKFKDDLTIVYRYFPLPGHKNSSTSATVVEAASRQGKFHEMKDLLFSNQEKRGESSFTDISQFAPYAQALGLDMEKYQNDIKDGEVLKRILRDKNNGIALGVTGTPSFFLNGEKINNPRTYDEFETLINAEIIKARDVGVKVHEHADIKIYIEGKELDLGQEKYQSTDEKPLDTDTHLHDGNGNNIHKHRTKKTIGDLFTSIGITFTKDCLILDTGEKYCNSGENTLKFFVNGGENSSFGNYELVDLDRILISFGKENTDELSKQISSVTDQACMYSEKCPERGKPPTENCVVGLGGDC